tara:strand:- start:1248 stop:2390 length:1143 start_codon:yes stop_codon:yes gene_type:complete
MYKLDRPFSFHIELTDKCNARCVQCERNEILKDGTLRENPKLLQAEISIDQFKSIFKNYQKQTKYIAFCGNYGDPMFAKDIFQITEYCITNVLGNYHQGGLKYFTNGGYKSKEWWGQLAKLLKPIDHLVVFAIDGLEDTNHLYRVNTRFSRIIENAKAFIDNGGDAEWSFIRFGHNQHQEEEIRKLAKDLGFKRFTASNSQRFKKRKEIEYIWNGEKNSILRYDSKLAKATPVSMKKYKSVNSSKIAGKDANEINDMLQKNAEKYYSDPEKVRMESVKQIDCFTEKKNEIYIDAKGYVYPCCWIGSYEYEKMTGIDDWLWNPQIDGRTFTSSFDVDFKEILKEDWFEHQLPDSWETDPCHICSRHCGKHLLKTSRQSERI